MNTDDWRKGQTAFNFVRLVRPDIAQKILGTDADPFYNDAKLPGFWVAVEALLKEENGKDR